MEPKPQPQNHSSMYASRIPRSTGDFLLIVIGMVSGLLYLASLVIENLPFFVFAPVPLLWLVYCVTRRNLHSSTPLDFAILGLFLLSVGGVFFTHQMSEYLPKLTGLALSISLYYVIVNWLRFRQRLNAILFWLLCLALGIALLAFLGTDWPVGGFSLFDRIYRHLPVLPFFEVGEKINKNTMGGALLFFPPLLLSLYWDKGAFSRHKSRYRWLAKLSESQYKAIILVVLLLVSLALLLTQSRGAILGCFAGVCLWLMLADKRFRWLVPTCLAITAIALLAYANGDLSSLLSMLETHQEATLPGRVEIWQKALVLLGDYPLSGVTLGNFSELYRLYYASIVLPSPTDVVFHAHNTFLSVAIEVGLPGCILYASLYGSFLAMTWKALKAKRKLNRVLVRGLACAVAGFVVFGLLDAFTLGRNLEILFWIFLGLMTALYVHKDSLNSSRVSYSQAEAETAPNTRTRPHQKMAIQSFFLQLAIWLGLSVISVSLVNILTLWGFFFAVLAGIISGFFVVTRFESEPR